MPTFSHAVFYVLETGDRGGEVIGCLTRYLVMCPSGYLAWGSNNLFAGRKHHDR
jgi:hypothetical protein